MNNGAIMNALNGIIDASMSNTKRRPVDYYKDGVLFCGICNTPKEKHLEAVFGGSKIDRVVGCLCRCESERIQKEKEEQEKQELVERGKRLRNISLMDERFFDATFDAWVDTTSNAKNRRLCWRYATAFAEMLEKNQGLLFWGDVGTGKSYAAACIANYLIDRKATVVMTSFVKLLQMVGSQEEEGNLINRMMTAKLVIFDDLGSERGTDYSLEKVYSIIDNRYRSKLPMIVTTNLSLKEMFDEQDLRYKRIYDRIFEVCYPMQWTGPSWRKMQAQDRFAEMAKILGETQW